MKTIRFLFEFASTYSYPAAMRIEPLARAAGVSVRYEPILLGPIFRAQGLRDSPFNVYEAKGRYMWRDLERICAAEGLPFRRSSAFPRNGLLAARVALVAIDEGFGPELVRAVYGASFAEDRDIADPAVIGAILRSLGRDAEGTLERAASPAIKERLRAQTDAAEKSGVFGAPSFLVDGELFWGNDRLEQALAWASRA